MLLYLYLISFYSMVLGTLITLSSSSWLTAWLGMELNLLSFIPLMLNKNNLFSTEASMKYFLIQALASSIFIMFFSILNLNIFSNNYLNFMILSALLLKIAAAPFHFWLPPIATSLSWYSLFLIMTWQKLAPLAIIMMMPLNISWVILLNLMLGPSMSLNQSSIKKLLIYSSIAHSGWIMSTIILNINTFIYYYLLYSVSLFPVIMMFNTFNMNSIPQLLSLNKKYNILLFLNMLSMSGFPPFLMFFPKLLILKDIILLNMTLSLFLVLSSLLAMYSYLQIVWTNFMKPSSLSKLQLMHPLLSFYLMILVIPTASFLTISLFYYIS